MHDPALQQVRIEKKDKPAFVKDSKTEEDPFIIHEKLPENRIHVLLTLTSPHAFIRATAEHAKKRQPDKYGRIELRGIEGLDILVSPAALPRALRIMDALIKALEKRGMTTSIKKTRNFETQVFVKGEELSVGIYEPSRQMDHVLTPAEEKDIKKYGRSPSWFQKYDYIPSGKLSLIMKTGWDSVTVVKDMEKRPIEESLNEFIVGLIKAAEIKKADRLEREKRREAEEEARRRREEFERQRREEEEKYRQLEKQVEAWNKSRLIRDFVEAVKNVAMQRDGTIEPGSDLETWINWAKKQADRIDPII